MRLTLICNNCLKPLWYFNEEEHFYGRLITADLFTKMENGPNAPISETKTICPYCSKRFLTRLNTVRTLEKGILPIQKRKE